jgi:hypothetical protein
MQVQFLAGVKKDRSDKVARLKEFKLPTIMLNDNNVEVIPIVSKKPLPEPSMKSTMESDKLLASYIAHLEHLEDLEKDRSLGFNNNETNSSTHKANPQGSYHSLAPLPINNANHACGLTLNPASGQYPQFQPLRPNWPHRSNRCRVPVRPVPWSWCPTSLCQFLSRQMLTVNNCIKVRL